ncbi:MAG: GspE/PulE family protein [Phycisphaerae bacterium]
MIEAAGGIAALSLLADVPTPGGYLAGWKIVLMLVFVTPWLMAAPWVARDERLVRAPKNLWSGLTVGVGALSFLLWLAIPAYVVGLLLYVVLTAGTIVAYVVYRNGRVEPEDRVLTAEHLGTVFGGKGTSRKAGSQRAADAPQVEIQDYEERPVPAPTEEMDPAIIRGYDLAQDLLYDVAWRRVSEVDVVPAGGGSRVRLVIDGVATEKESLAAPDAEALVQYVKAVAGLDVEDRRRPQEGKLYVAYNAPAFEVAVQTAGTTGGQRMKLRVTQEVVQTRLEELGLAQDTLERVKTLSGQKSGLLIASGPRRSGVTSTLYSLLRAQDAFTKQLITVEEKPEVDLENVTQNVYEAPAQQAQVLSSAVRRDPDVVMVDRLASDDTPGVIMEAATEKMVFLGVNAPDSFTALAVWVKHCKTPESLKNLRGVLCQTLVRKLCPACREAYRPDPNLLAKVNLPADKITQFYRPPSSPLTDEKGRPITCPSCQGSGYVGRTGAYELLEVTDDLRKLVADGGSLSQLRSAARKNKMLYLQEQLLRKVIEGVTSIQEIIRVQQEQSKKRSKA